MPRWGVHTGLQNTTTDELRGLSHRIEDRAAITCPVNVGAAVDDDALHAQFGNTAEFVRPGVLIGSPEQMIDQVGRYAEVGVDQINLAMRAPWDLSILEHVAEVMAAAG